MEPGSKVWMCLGHSYGRWPAIVSEHQRRPSINQGIHNQNLVLFAYKQFQIADILKELGESFLRNEKEAAVDNGELYVKFFDDEDLELMPVTELNKIESYSCKNKKKYIRCLLSTGWFFLLVRPKKRLSVRSHVNH